MFVYGARDIDHEVRKASLAHVFPVMVLACLDAAFLLSPLKIWELAGPLLLFLGLLTLLNAPFDWASLGVLSQ